jgi:guanylate kinase
MLNRPPDHGRLFVVTGPSGVGKSTLIAHVRQVVPALGFSVSATTRARRADEINGEDYLFLSDEVFQSHVDQGDFLEHAVVYSHRYGTLRSAADQVMKRGQSLILDIDLLGARQIRASRPDAVLVFILPPSIKALRHRLNARGTDSNMVIERRMSQVAVQIMGCNEFDYVVMNDDLEEAKAYLLAIFLAEYSRSSSRVHWIEEAREQSSEWMKTSEIGEGT